MSDRIPNPFIHPDSLGDTLDTVNASLFYGKEMTIKEKIEAAGWIAERQGLPGSYAGMFAPTGYDHAFGALTFTGDLIRSGAATGHILSEEACRALFLLSRAAEVAAMPEVTHAIERARDGIFNRIAASEARGAEAGVYCCGTCSAALWRHLSAGGSSEDEHRLENGISELRRHRDGNGRWRRFPFHYTLLALSAIDLPAAREEAAYAYAAVERALRRLEKIDLSEISEHDRRRKIVMERILGKNAE